MSAPPSPLNTTISSILTYKKQNKKRTVIHLFDERTKYVNLGFFTEMFQFITFIYVEAKIHRVRGDLQKKTVYLRTLSK